VLLFLTVGYLELFMTAHKSTVVDARIPREIKSDRDRGVEKFI